MVRVPLFSHRHMKKTGSFAGRRRVDLVEHGLGRRWDFCTREDWIIGVLHPALEAVAHVGDDVAHAGIGGEVVALVGVEDEIVELLSGDLALAPALCEQQVFADAVVAIGKHGANVAGVIGNVAANIFVAFGAHGALRFVGGVVADFGEDFVVDLVGFAAQNGQE